MGTPHYPTSKYSLYFYPEAIDFPPLTEGFFGKCPNNRNCSRVEGSNLPISDMYVCLSVCLPASVSRFKRHIYCLLLIVLPSLVGAFWRMMYQSANAASNEIFHRILIY